MHLVLLCVCHLLGDLWWVGRSLVGVAVGHFFVSLWLATGFEFVWRCALERCDVTRLHVAHLGVVGAFALRGVRGLHGSELVKLFVPHRRFW